VTYGFDGKRIEGTVITTMSPGQPLSIRLDPDGDRSVSVEGAIVTSDISSGEGIGAPVLTPAGNLVGMIFATGRGGTIVLPVEPVLVELKLELMR
jgi:hypothetical protein